MFLLSWWENPPAFLLRTDGGRGIRIEHPLRVPRMDFLTRSGGEEPVPERSEWDGIRIHTPCECPGWTVWVRSGNDMVNLAEGEGFELNTPCGCPEWTFYPRSGGEEPVPERSEWDGIRIEHPLRVPRMDILTEIWRRGACPRA
jgi:hypothetical protein